MDSSIGGMRPGRLPGPDLGKRILLAVFLFLAFFVTACGLWPAAWFYFHYVYLCTTVWQWMLLVFASVLIFHYGYLLGLLALRIVTPKPKPGRYPRQPDGKPPNELMVYMFNVLLLKLRHGMPWSNTLTPSLIALPPLRRVFRKLFGPDTSSMTLGDTAKVLDPWLVQLGDRVQLGYGCLLTCHFYDNRGMMLFPIVVEDDAVIGGEAFLCPGVHVGHDSVVAARAIVTPNTVIGPYELWSGNPAKKVRDIPPDELKPSADNAVVEAALFSEAKHP